MANDINKIFQNLRNEFIVVGLTGALGSGCTTAAEFLTKEHKSVEHFFSSIDVKEFDFDYRKSLRVKQFYDNNPWQSFYHIRVSDVLLLVMFFQIKKFENLPTLHDFDDLSKYETIETFFINFSNEQFDEIKKLSTLFIDMIDNPDNHSENMNKLLTDVKNFINLHINKTVSSYTKVFQLLGENIRTSGMIFHKNSNYKVEKQIPSFELSDLPIFIIPEILRRTIKYLNRQEEIKFFAIDALRNIYEIEYFRNRYQSFYLLSILASESTRRDRLLKGFNIGEQDILKIKTYETSNKEIEQQAINKCIVKGDIFINNDTGTANHTDLNIALLNYIALIRKPGLFIPSNDERFMQVAFTARYSSGCISRQVGAVVAGKDGYIRGFGWNDVPEKHIPCIYRTPQQLLDNDKNFIFSEYERSETFFKHVNQLKSEQTELPFCFKDQQNEIDQSKDKTKIYQEITRLSAIPNVDVEELTSLVKTLKMKNPTRERALHAEENAFLQIAKSGGQSVAEGTLYTTDSPCQLCAKKAMQLKIKRIVYIDAYPDISEKHTLNAGAKEEWPKLDMFNGILGAAYFKLYIPIIGIKEENNLLIK